MNHNTLISLFWISFVLGIVIGFYLFFIWCKRKWNIFKENPSLNKVFLLALPGVFFMIIAFIPTLYFNYLLKQEKYCISVIQFNKNIKKNDSFLIERCNCLNINELFEKAKSTNNTQ